MARFSVSSLLLLAILAFSGIQFSSCLVVKGKVSCLDCSRHYDFSEIKVAVKCNKLRKLATTTTQSDGSFEVELPSDTSKTATDPQNCLAKLLGGPSQLYVSRENMVSRIVQAHGSNTYTVSTPLVFSTTCRLGEGKCGNELGDSKTVDLPLPREWGLAPSSYYVPFFPIIGIP